MIIYDIAHNEAAHKYLFKVFYNKTIKKKYELQIWQYNMWHTNIIAIKDVIILKKAQEEKILSEGIADITAPMKIDQVLSLVDLAGRYN